MVLEDRIATAEKQLGVKYETPNFETRIGVLEQKQKLQASGNLDDRMLAIEKSITSKEEKNG